MSAPPNANLSIGVGLNPGSAPVNSKIQRFNLEVFIPRIIASCIVVAVGSVSFVVTCIIILNLLTSSSRSPNKAFPIFTLSGGLGIILVTSVPIFLVLIHAKVSHVFPATMRKRRIERLKTEMAPEKIGCMVLHTLSTILLMLGMILLGPREFSQVSVMCQNTRRCLNGFMVFPLLVGMFLSCRLTFAHYFRNGALVNYPCIKQHRFIQGKSAFASALRMAWRSALRDVPFFCLTFVVLGNQFSKWLSQYVELGFSYEPFWTDWRFFLSMLIFAVVLVTVHEFSWAIFQIFITQHHEFEISQELDPPLSLLTALEDESNLQLNYLAHMDFCHLAQHSPLRRKSVFALSPIEGDQSEKRLLYQQPPSW
ncbi:unnamed protein product [Darwinula stevensoni]|uniref:Uncharacterized protein n=1 Tax=Darwinula stevensoni TaxID=69355 RepID=A0A7R9FQK1_9CRUS|nr:unnamed protein product [Darwinula stevensoni]CAG0899652.1 unnamed protein product [Darwinula stevensoni]